jgi:tetratricopeptide (TPR) repeat protein/predicted Ser/Thr protein kinase
MTERSEDAGTLDDALTRFEHAAERTAVLDPGAEEPSGLALLVAPTTIGRYRVTGELGRGGMGVVYRAHDPTLDRTVAIKLVRPTRADSEARARLAREARVLARLSHPNVVEVFEIGEHEGQLFIAMELVRGRDLGRWRAAAPRSHGEILDVMIDAGRGLAAAHAAGLVHRDFKPDNVVVGDDGRVRVLDFGLARAAFAVPSTDSGRAEPALDEPESGSGTYGTVTVAPEDRLTQTGIAMGTPAYMAPEQFRRTVDDPRVDQFAFGVALFELLAGRRPFKARSYEELAKVVTRGEIHEPDAHPIARPLFRVLRRALAPAPDDRYADMHALLAALDAARRPARWRWAAAGLGVAVVGTVGAVLLLQPPTQAPCPDAEQLHDELWGQEHKVPVRDAILASAVVYAEPTWAQVDAAVDDYARAWSGAHHEVCLQMRAVDSHADERLACLEHRRVALRAVLDVLACADETTVHNARSTVARLPSVQACDTAPLRGGAPDSAATPEQEELEAHLATARAHYDMGRYAAGLYELSTIATVLGPDASPGLVAAYQLTRGQLEMAQGRALPGAEALEAAYFAALESEQLDVACRAASLVVAEPAVPYRERWQWAAHAKAALERHGDDEELAWVHERAMCALQSDSGALDEALEHCERALAMVEHREPADPEATVQALAELGSVVAAAEDRQRAYEVRSRALDLAERTLGPQHPLVANAANDLGWAALALGRYEEASTLAERALAIRRATLGTEHPDVVLAEDLQARIHFNQSRYAPAKALAEQGLALRQQTYGDTHPLVARSLLALALAQEELDEPEAALLSMQRVAEIDEQLHPLNIQRLPTLREQARMAFMIGKGPKEGRKHLERAWEIVRESEIPGDHPLVLDLCHGYGETLLELGEAETALPYLERYVAKSTETRIRPHVEFVLARALVATGGDRARALGLVRAGIDTWGASTDEFHRSQVADMRAWLAVQEPR